MCQPNDLNIYTEREIVKIPITNTFCRVVYKKYCSSESLKATSKNLVSGNLRDVGINLIKKNGNILWVNMKFEELKQLFEKKHWIHETDEYIEDKPVECDFEDKDKPDEHMELVINNKDKEIEDLNNKIKALEEKLKQLEKKEEILVDSGFDSLVTKKVEKRHKIPVDKFKKMEEYDKSKKDIIAKPKSKSKSKVIEIKGEVQGFNPENVNIDEIVDRVDGGFIMST
jgi:hypothetical protein